MSELMVDAEYEKELEPQPIVDSTLSVLSRSEIDGQIATARRFPRSIKVALDELTSLATLNEDVAGDCIYALPRGGKKIEGPSIRFAEIAASAWGNCRCASRVVEIGDDYVTSQGIFHDLQKNVAISTEVRRRITKANGDRYDSDMIGVTANAASSVALRNAILRGIPKALWQEAYFQAKQTAIGKAESMGERRHKLVDHFGKMGVTPQQICALLEVGGIDDIGFDHLVLLRGVATAIKTGGTTIDAQFPEDPTAVKIRQKKKLDEVTKAATGKQSDAKPADKKTAPAEFDIQGFADRIEAAPTEAAVNKLDNEMFGPESIVPKQSEAAEDFIRGCMTAKRKLLAKK